MILIVSGDKDFSGALAEQVTRQLGLACTEIEAIENNKSFMDAVTAIVTDGTVGVTSLPVISVAGKKPLRLRELLAEIEKTQHKPASKKMRALGKQYRFSPLEKELQHSPSKKSVSLTDKESKMLQLMADAGKQGVAKEELLKQIWGFEAGLNTHTLETHIYRLRGKFKDISGNDTIVEAMDGGYRLAI